MTEAQKRKRPRSERPEKKTRKRRRCDNCNKLYRPTRDDQKFCRDRKSDTGEVDPDRCRKEYYRYGSSYGPLKTGLHKAIEKKYAELEKSITVRLLPIVDGLAKLEARIVRLEQGGSNFTINSIKEAINRLAVENEQLRAQINAARGQNKIG